MASYCCVCGRKIGFMDGYTTLSEDNKIICSQCSLLLSDYNDRLWSCTDKEEADRIKQETTDYIHSYCSSLQNPDNLILYFEGKYAERLKYLTPEQTSDKPARAVPPPPPPSPYDELRSKMILSTAGSLEGYRITKQLGVVFGETVFKPSAGQQFASAVGDMFRSLSFSAKEMTGQVAIIEEARKFAYVKMMKHALDRGANAIIAIDSDNTIGESICYLSLYGTAVYAEPIE